MTMEDAELPPQQKVVGMGWDGMAELRVKLRREFLQAKLHAIYFNLGEKE